MNNSMITAMVSLGGIQQKLDIIADNMANLNTNGYKKKQASFEDLLTTIQKHDKTMKLPGRVSPLGFNQAWGARLGTMTRNMEQGGMLNTGNTTDLAIEGDALFEVRTSDTTKAWTRGGSFELTLMKEDDEHAYLATSQGYPVLGTNDEPIEIPNGYRMQVDEQGNVTAHNPNSDEVLSVGRIRLVQVSQPNLLQQTADNLFVLPAGQEGLVDEIDMDDTTRGFKSVGVRQGFLEQSNVNLTDEVTDLMQVQRAYQLTAKALTSSDTMLGLVNNLRG